MAQATPRAAELEEFRIVGELGHQIGREVPGQIRFGLLGDLPLPVCFAQLVQIIEGLLDGDLEVVEGDGFGDEIEGAEVHRGADVRHIAIGGNDHGLQFSFERRQPVRPAKRLQASVSESRWEMPHSG